MSQILIQRYLNQLGDLRRVGGTSRESVVREAFKDLLKGWGRARDLIFVPEYGIETPTKQRRYVDGALLHELRVPFGYWEAKDEKDDLDEEIAAKFRRGYPQDNILFEDSRTLVLYQHRREVTRCPVDDVDRLQQALDLFFTYERPEIAEFRKAIGQFKADLPAVLDALRGMIEEQHAASATFQAAAERFLAHGKKTINPSLTEADVREMLIQHILTEEIFTHVFDEGDFHRQNNVARALYALEGEFFTGPVKSARSRRWSPTTPRSEPRPRRSAATTRSRPSSRSSTRASTRSTTGRPPTGWAWSTRPTRSCASWSRAPTGSASSTSGSA